jgi:tRNA pseudouridine38-40 synthase
LQAALNAKLPPDASAQAVQLAAPGFHPRFDALARCYRYHIYCQPQRDPLRERYAWRVWPAVSLERLQQAAAYLPGTHDFSAFGTPPRTGGTTIRTVSAASWAQVGDGCVFEIVANAFLYRMVRRLVRTLVLCGQAELEPQIIQSLLAQPPRKMVQGLAPAQGLVLAEVIYPPGEPQQAK